MNKFEANDIINDLSDAQREMLVQARAGIPLHEADKRTLENLRERGLVRTVNFEHVRATTAIQGIIPSDDGEKVLQELDNRPAAIETDKTKVVENGKTETVTEVKVNDPNPADNQPKKATVKKN